MIYIPCTKCGVGSVYANIAKEAAVEPDSWDDGFWQSYHHYYNPTTNTGNGAYNCYYYANLAKNKYDIPELQMHIQILDTQVTICLI